MIAVKKTVAPIPTYLVCSPSEQEESKSSSAPEHRIKKRFNMIDFDLIDDVTNLTPNFQNQYKNVDLFFIKL